jgi:hypothetical protein
MLRDTGKWRACEAFASIAVAYERIGRTNDAPAQPQQHKGGRRVEGSENGRENMRGPARMDDRVMSCSGPRPRDPQMGRAIGTIKVKIKVHWKVTITDTNKSNTIPR